MDLELTVKQNEIEFMKKKSSFSWQTFT